MGYLQTLGQAWMSPFGHRPHGNGGTGQNDLNRPDSGFHAAEVCHGSGYDCESRRTGADHADYPKSPMGWM